MTVHQPTSLFSLSLHIYLTWLGRTFNFFTSCWNAASILTPSEIWLGRRALSFDLGLQYPTRDQQANQPTSQPVNPRSLFPGIAFFIILPDE